MTTLDPSRTAILAMDFQSIVVNNYFAESAAPKNMAAAIELGRAAGATIVFVTVGFREGYPEISDRNPVFAGFKGSGGAFVEGSEGFEIHPDLGARSDDLVVIKRRMGAFAHTDLDLLLRTREIDTIVLGGLATSGVVLSTVRAAGDLDYRIVVLDDCCSDFEDEVQKVLMEKIFPFQGTVASTHDLKSLLAA